MVYFVSGHRDLSYEDFEKYYIPKIEEVIERDPRAEFVVGDCDGVDKYAMDYIFSETMSSLTIYHMFDKPRNTPNNKSIDGLVIISYRYISFESGFHSDEERDSAMTHASDCDIAFIKNNRWDSGTAQNIKRRHEISNNLFNSPDNISDSTDD